MQGSKMLMNFFDSAFAIGRSFSNVQLRYIKQIKQRNCEQIYNEENVVVCELYKGSDNNFLQFKFMNCDSEYNHLNYERQKSKADLYNEAKRLRSDGMTYEKIGEELGFGESTIRYWFKTKL